MSAQTLEFRAEVRQLLDLMIHSLYSHKEVFLRELISNASDAVDKARYASLTDGSVLEDGGEWSIRITPDEAAGTLKVSDNGIGMTREEAVEALGTIAHSGTKEFLKVLSEKNLKDHPELIGQFGVGFYAAFMVADRITVISRKAGQAATSAVRWESTADGTFTVAGAERASRGTDVILHLKGDEKQYLDEWKIKEVVRKYSDFIEHPIVMEVEKKEESTLRKGETITVRSDEVLNSRKALWLRDKAEITDEEYNEFYRHVSHDFGDPLRVLHFRAEGTSEFSALLYIPAEAPLNILYPDYKIGPMLYVRRVRIMDHCEALIPSYLRFAKGVVESTDLPLNVSRELLQSNSQVELIRKNVTRKVLDLLAEMKKHDYEKYLIFYKEFGRVLKEGVHLDYARRENIADLLLFGSTTAHADAFTTLENYVSGMREDQKEIYYLAGTSRDEMLASPYLESFRKKGIEVLLMTDDIDDFVFAGFEYKGKPFKSVLRGTLPLDEKQAEAAREMGDLLSFIKEALKDEVKDVRASGRLTDSACCLVADEGDIDPRMERMLKAMGQEVPKAKRILEVNTAHPLFEAMERRYREDRADPLLAGYAGMLYDQALLLEGSKPRDIAAFTKRLADLMAAALAGKGQG